MGRGSLKVEELERNIKRNTHTQYTIRNTQWSPETPSSEWGRGFQYTDQETVLQHRRHSHRVRVQIISLVRQLPPALSLLTGVWVYALSLLMAPKPTLLPSHSTIGFAFRTRGVDCRRTIQRVWVITFCELFLNSRSFTLSPHTAHRTPHTTDSTVVRLGSRSASLSSSSTIGRQYRQV